MALPKRLRYFVHRDPELTGHVLKVWRRALVTLFSLFVVPSLYVLIARDHTWEGAPGGVPLDLVPSAGAAGS